MEIPKLPKYFKEPTKTKKLTVIEGSSLVDAVHSAREWLNAQTEYNRIEFKYDTNYIVIAKLKDKD